MLDRMLRRTTRTYPESAALAYGPPELSYQTLYARVVGLSEGLARLGIGEADPIIIALPNSPEFVLSYFAAARQHAIVATVDPACTEYEFTRYLEHRRPHLVITDQPHAAERLKQLGGAAKLVVAGASGRPGIPFDDLVLPHDGDVPEPSQYEGDFVYLYSSGSTGQPKCICRTQGDQAAEAEHIVASVGITASDAILCVIPLFHSFAQFCCMTVAIRAGAKLVLLEHSPSGDWGDVAFAAKCTQVLQLIENHKVTIFPAVPYVFNALAETPPDVNVDFSSVRYCFSSGSFLPRSTFDHFRERFGIGIRQTYGSAEAGSVSWNVDDVTDVAHTSVGRPLQGVEVAILGEDGRELPTGAVGEIAVKSLSVMLGYVDAPEADQKLFRDGFFLTGDLGRKDDRGHLYLSGRKRLLIDAGGFKIDPTEIEQVLQQHPRVRDAVVIGISLPGVGQLVKAIVVADETCRADEVLSFCHERLPSFKVPSILEFRDKIPRNPLGKVQLDALVTGPKARIGEQWSGKGVLSREILLGAFPQTRRQLVESYLIDEVARTLRVDRKEIEPSRQLSTLGVDSLALLLLRAAFETDLGINISLATLLQGPSIEELAALLTAQLSAGGLTPPLPVAAGSEDGQHALSYGQRSMWHMYHLAPTSAAYNRSFAARVVAGLDVPALHRSFQGLVDRHASLRTRFRSADGVPVQEVLTRLSVDFQERDASRWTAEELTKTIEIEANRPFDLGCEGPLRVRLFTGTPQGNVLLVTLHHISCDFWSLVMLLEELGVLYAAEHLGAEAYLPECVVRYTDYARWETGLVEGPIGERAWRYWQAKLAGELPVINLPTDQPRPPVQTFAGGVYFSEIAPGLVGKLRSLARTHRVTLYTTLLATFEVLLHRYTGQTDILLGSAATSRTRAEFQDIVGFFVNIVVMRALLGVGMTFKEFMAQVQRDVLEAVEHQVLPFPLLVERLQPKRDPSHSPLFDVLFAYDRPQRREMRGVARFAAGRGGELMNLGGLVLESYPLRQRSAMYDLTLLVYDAEDALLLSWEYNTDLFNHDTVARMAGHFRTLLEAVVADPLARISDLPLLTPLEQRRILTDWNATTMKYPRDRCLHQLFEDQVVRAPDSVALIHGDLNLTYAELNERANRLARALERQGVGPEILVGICMERSPDAVVGLLGILKSGGAYVSLSPTDPPERLAFMLEDTSLPLLLTQERLLHRLPQHSAQAMCLQREWKTIERQGCDNPNCRVDPENLAYVIYTSGSTGRPKGVAITHRGIVNNVIDMNTRFGVGSSDRILSLSSLSFDMSVYELLGVLGAGAATVLPSDELDVAHWAGLIKQHRITIWHTAPAVLSMLLNFAEGHADIDISSIRVAVLGGDWIPVPLPDRLKSLAPGVEVISLGGATEASIHSIMYCIGTVSPEWKSIPYGRPLANQTAFILDARHQVLPVGIPGELYLGGIGLARGYAKRPELTAERFLPCPFAEPGSQMYRTGDLARYQSDGTIELLGRMDFQVKIRGFRIEIGEVELALRTHSTVKEAAVVDREDRDDKRLLAYVVPATGQELAVNALREHLRQTLPAYMIPSNFIVMSSLPLSANGKVDRRALPAPEQVLAEVTAQLGAPRTSLEKLLSDIWRDLLGAQHVGVHDNFFDLGGHSLLAMQLVARIRAACGVELPLRAVFEARTLSEIAVAILRRQTEQEDREQLIG